MATPEERRALLAVTCPHCGAQPKEVCAVPHSRREHGRRARGLPITTLDGGCHDARWRLALGRSAEVDADALRERHEAAPVRPVHAVAAAAGPAERPW